MKKIAENICGVMHDYHKYLGFEFNPDHVLKWVSQFDKGDQFFILEEFLHLLNQGIYVDELAVRGILLKLVKKIITASKVKNEVVFFENTEFLNVQSKEKSQGVLLNILNEELKKYFNITLSECGRSSKKYTIYIDDILATGGTIFNHCDAWLEAKNDDGETNATKLKNGQKIFIVCLLCKHTWGVHNLKTRLKIKYGDTVITKVYFVSDYVIYNHPVTPNEKLNIAYPYEKGQSKLVDEYINSLDATYKGEFAYRKVGTPKDEAFFSSPQNRIRFENVILNKGIELLAKVKHLEKNQRPLGITNPTKKIFGTGTLFFTWRNISNTTPIVFWWKVNWYPLFPLINRGLKKLN